MTWGKKKKPTGSYYERNRERKLAKSKEYYLKNREKVLQRESARYYATRVLQAPKPRLIGTWHQRNKEKTRESCRQYYRANKDKVRHYRRRPEYKIADALRSRIKDAIKGRTKAGSAVKDLGCTVQEFKTYLEQQFQPGMSWDNHGFYGWHVDHKLPLASFDLTNRNEFMKAAHYTNLQPLWAKDNLTKKDKIIKEYGVET